MDDFSAQGASKAMKIAKMTPGQTIATGNLIYEHCKGNGQDAAYEDGWSDKRVWQVHAEDARAKGLPVVSEQAISNLRLKLVGRIKPAPTVAVAERVDALEREVAALHKTVANLSRWAAARPVQPFSFVRPFELTGG